MSLPEETIRPVWLNLNQKALDDAYDQAVYAPNFRQLHERRIANSAAVRKQIGEPKRLSYGPTPIEQFDLYRTSKPRAPIMIAVHGGAWRDGLAKDFADSAEMFVRAGAHFVVFDFINVIEAGGDLRPMVNQVRRAIGWIGNHANTFGGNPDRLYLFGRSSGAHLAGVALTTDWASTFNLPNNLIKGAVLSSGIYDLKPVRLSKRSIYITFTDEIEEALSPQRHVARINCPVVIAYGTYETPEFQRQSYDFAKTLEQADKPVRLLVGVGYNHFELPETLANPYGLLGRAALQLMQLDQGETHVHRLALHTGDNPS
jgi:arylformamidase